MTAIFQDLGSVLSECLPDKTLRLQVNQAGSQISVVMNRPADEPAANYQEVAEILIEKLRSLNLPNVDAVKLYGRLANTKKVEWQILRSLVTEVDKPVVSNLSVIEDTPSQKLKSKFQDYLEQFSHYSNVISAASLLGLLLLLSFNTLAGQKPQPSVWEYKIVSVPDLTFTETMDQIGSDRWELVSLVVQKILQQMTFPTSASLDELKSRASSIKSNNVAFIRERMLANQGKEERGQR